jgi:hypothetical protein
MRRQPLPRFLLLGALFALSLDGCNEAGSSAARTRVFDSAGVTIVENRDAQPPDIAAWQVDSVPLLSIGREDGPDPYRFDGVYDITRLSDSTIVVADGSPSIRFFDMQGQFLHAVGRRGDGPGEYRVINFIHRFHGDSLLVWDYPRLHVTMLAPDGVFARSVQGPATEGFFADDAFPDGSLLGTYSRGVTADNSVSGILHVTDAVVRVTPGSDALDTLALVGTAPSFISGGEHFLMRSIPFSAGVATVAAGQGVYVASTAAFDISYYQTDGQLVRIIRLNRPPVPIDKSARDHFIASRLASARSDADRQRQVALYDGLPFPDDFPAFSAMIVDADSNLWVRTYTTSDSVPSQWTIFDPVGRLLAEATTPARFTVFEIGRGDILGVQEDSLGVQQVRVLRVQKK